MMNSKGILEHMCRACMRKNLICYSLCDEAKGIPLTIYEMFASTIPQVPIHNNDELPKKICVACLNILNIVHKFQQTCIASDTYMRSLLVSHRLASHNSTTKQEEYINHIAMEQGTEKLDIRPVTPRSIKVEINELVSESMLLDTSEECRDNDAFDSEWSEGDDIPLRRSVNLRVNPNPLVKEEFQNCMKYEANDVEVQEYDLEAILVTESLENKTVPVVFKDGHDNDITTELGANNDSWKASEELEFLNFNSPCEEKPISKVNKTVQQQPSTSSDNNESVVHEIEKYNPKRKQNFRCQLCNAAFDSKYRLDHHVSVHLETNTFVCQICNYRYKTINGLGSHKKLIHEIPSSAGGHQCSKCPRRFETHNFMTAHVRKSHSLKKSGFCGNFDKEFTSKTIQLAHQYKKPAVICPQCNKSFQNNKLLGTHMRRHLGKRKFQCSECSKGFAFKYERTRHMKIHQDIRENSCDVCSSIFTHADSLTKHKLKHTSERPHKCGRCDQTFSSIYILKRHEFKHTGERPFKCDQCEKTFACTYNMKAHQRNVHTND